MLWFPPLLHYVHTEGRAELLFLDPGNLVKIQFFLIVHWVYRVMTGLSKHDNLKFRSFIPKVARRFNEGAASSYILTVRRIENVETTTFESRVDLLIAKFERDSGIQLLQNGGSEGKITAFYRSYANPYPQECYFYCYIVPDPTRSRYQMLISGSKMSSLLGTLQAFRRLMNGIKHVYEDEDNEEPNNRVFHVHYPLVLLLKTAVRGNEARLAGFYSLPPQDPRSALWWVYRWPPVGSSVGLPDA